MNKKRTFGFVFFRLLFMFIAYGKCLNNKALSKAFKVKMPTTITIVVGIFGLVLRVWCVVSKCFRVN